MKPRSLHQPTSLEEALAELTRTRAQLAKAHERLATIDKQLERFTQVAAHDLRSPLRTIGSFAGLLRHRLTDRLSIDEVEMIEQIQGGAIRINTLLEAVLDLARSRHQRYDTIELIDVPTVVGEIADAVDPKQLHVIEFVGTTPRVRTSLAAVRQVLRNLISNAVRYTDKASATIAVSCERIGDTVRLTVADDGPGIAPEDQERIFRAFETGERIPHVPSAGLGLAIVRHIVDRMDGRIDVVSSPGEGSKFVLSLPSVRKA